MDEQRLLIANARHRSVGADTAIFREGEAADRVLIIHHGRVKLNHYSLEGKEYVLDILGAGSVYGEQYLFSRQAFDANAIALDNVTLCEIYQRDIEAVIHNRPEVAIKMLQVLGGKFARASRLAELLSVDDAAARLAGYLLFRMRHQNSPTICLARADIAASINLRVETISRKLGEMQRSGMVVLGGHRNIRIVDEAALRAVYESGK